MKRSAFETVRGEHEKYFQALSQHPRLLVGTEVPSLTGEGMERLRDTADAREWQEAIKSILVQEIDARARTLTEERRPFIDTVHSSIELFKRNKDLIPGAPGFDRDLADRFAQIAKPYEVRVDGKLHGYSIPVQPLIDSIRQSRAKTPPVPQAQAAAPPAQPGPQPAEPPQAGLQSRSASGAEREDFSTLFGTIGLPNFRI